VLEQLDYVGKKRSQHSGQSLALDRESVLTQLLSEMDGFSANDGIVVIATTNRAVSYYTYVTTVKYHLHAILLYRVLCCGRP
jgi:AAA+ superfamily predicted ATPase